MTREAEKSALSSLREIIRQYWGYDQLRPLQEEAMSAVLRGQDSMVVLPTGGGKSLCYQAPAVLRGETTVVVSPLISLMKDQVDSLQTLGIPAIQIDSSQGMSERAAYREDVRQGAVRLLFVSPERLVMNEFCTLLQQINVRSFAIDEAHCISHWGHDFRPEYRQLAHLKRMFPQASVHGYTATATEQVRKDIIRQLGLKNPAVLVGNFDRPNLNYRVLPRQDLMNQVSEVLKRHKDEAGIIYCMRRADVDDLSRALQKLKFRALPYHAGMTADERSKTQNAFSAEKCDIVVATVAFGMGIDRSNVRFVLHAGMPKSLEHYQQETGRAGRDGLEAECVLLYSPSDTITWRRVMEKSAVENNADPEFLQHAKKHLDDMDRYARGATCRHRALVEYFGQQLDKPSCDACDICLGDTEDVPDATTVAKKILSCVARVKEGFGAGHVIGVLRGENTEGIRRRGHDKLSTYKLLEDVGKGELRDWIFQLVGQGVLVQTDSQYPVLKLNKASWEVMRGEKQVRLIRLVKHKQGENPQQSRADIDMWDGVDRTLFKILSELRQSTAEKLQKSSWIVFSDHSLRSLARVRPSTAGNMLRIYGVTQHKMREFGQQFLDRIVAYCRQNNISQDNPDFPSTSQERKGNIKSSPAKTVAFELFREGCDLADVVHQTQRSRSTVSDYLVDFIAETRPESIDQWVSDADYQRVAAAAERVGAERLRPIFEALNGEVPYDIIRLVLAHLGR